MSIIDKINPYIIAKNATLGAIGIAGDIVDYSLKTSAQYAEKADHLVRPVTTKTELQHTDVDGEYHSFVARTLEDLRLQIKRGLPVDLPLSTAAAAVDLLITSKFTGGMDDRLFFLEHVLVFLSRNPPDGKIGQKLQDKVISLLWADLPHPPASLVGRKYKYRSADGAGSSLWNPEMGKANTPYARSVQGTHPLPQSELPSPELLFDTLLKREKQEDHPSGLSSMFFAFANLVIHSLFYTDHFTDKNDPINKTSSYLDLSILYGNDQQQQDSVRVKDGTGKLHPDTFADARLLGMPPSTPALAVLFSRNHNFICQKLLEINERKEWTNPPPDFEIARLRQDEDIFQTARLINCGFFMNTILGDYLASILGLVRECNSWCLNPLEDFRNPDRTVSERGTGNVVSIEFQGMYTFHPGISAMDEKWTEKIFRKYIGEKSWDDIIPYDFASAIMQMKADWGSDPRYYPIADLKRKPDGRFDDGDLATILLDATANPASAFKARGTPWVMKVIEVMGIERQRAWGSCSLNEFRKFLGLKPYKTFEEWNPRPEIAEGARRLYGHPDNIELYVGCQAEESKPVVPGAGICCGFTQTRAILSDAVALTRGDRFLTNELTAHNLTAWGFNDCQRNPQNSSFGGTLGKLLMRTLPDYYPEDSVWTQFPLVVPSSMKTFLEKKDLTAHYRFERPLPLRPLTTIKSYAPAAVILASDSFKSTYQTNAEDVFPAKTKGYLTTLNDIAVNNNERKLIVDAFVHSMPSAERRHQDWFRRKTEELLRLKSYSLVGGTKRSVNVVRDVLNLLPVHFISDNVIGLPLKTELRQIGTFYEQELYEKMKAVYDYIFIENDPTTHVARREQAKDIVNNLRAMAGYHLSRLLGFTIPGLGLIDAGLHILLNQSNIPHEWIRRLRLASPRDVDEIINNIVSLAILVSVELSQIFTHVIDYYLPPSTQPDADIAANKLNARAATIGKRIVQSTQAASAYVLAPDPSQESSSDAGSTTNGDEQPESPSDPLKKLNLPKLSVPKVTPERQAELDVLTARAKEFADLCKLDDPHTNSRLQAKILEALKNAPAVPGLYRDAVTDVNIKGEMYKRGDRVYVDVAEAQKSAKSSDLADASAETGTIPTAGTPTAASSEPTQVLLGDGILRLMGQEWVLQMVLPVVKTIFRLRKLDRAKGNSGQLSSFTMEVQGTAQRNPETGEDEPETASYVRSYTDKHYIPTPWSSNLTVVYEE